MAGEKLKTQKGGGGAAGWSFVRLKRRKKNGGGCCNGKKAWRRLLFFCFKGLKEMVGPWVQMWGSVEKETAEGVAVFGFGLWPAAVEKKFKPRGKGGCRLGRDRFRVRLFFVFSDILKLPPLLNVLRKPVFICKMLLGFSTWSLNFFLFCKF